VEFEGPAAWGALGHSVAGSFFCCLTIASGFFWKLIVLGYPLDGWVLGFVAACFCLVAMSGGVGCAVGALAGVLSGMLVLGVVAWCLVVWGWLRSIW